MHVGGACHPVWQARDEVAEYGLRHQNFWSSKAEDGTTLTDVYCFLRILCQWQNSASREYYGGPADRRS